MSKTQNDLGIPPLSCEEREKRLLSTAGFAARAGKVVPGTGLICENLRKGQILLVLEAADTSDNTHKRLGDKTSFYEVPLVRLNADSEALAHAFGKRDGKLAAVGLTDAGIVRALQKYLPESISGE